MPDFDAVVVGSGVSGGWAAKELTERGLKVAMIERGRMVRHGEDYPNEHRAPWEFPFRGFGDRRRYATDFPVQSRCGNFNEGSDGFFVNDRENPYSSEGPDGGFDWVRGDQVGGRSLIWGRYAMRYAAHNFTDNLRDGHGIDWPIRYEEFAPWYGHVEDFIGVSGTSDGLDELPDSRVMPPLPINCVEEHVAQVTRDRFGRHLLPARAAILTQDHRGALCLPFLRPLLSRLLDRLLIIAES